MKKVCIILLVLVLSLSMVLLVACQGDQGYHYEIVGGDNGGGNQGGNGGNNGGNQGGNQGGNNGGTVTDDGGIYNLKIWCAEEDEEMIWEMLDAYADLHSKNKYNFTVEKAGEDVVSSKVTTDVNNAADVFSFANDQLGILLNQRALYQIPNIYKAQIESQTEVASIACKSNGNYYAIPYSYENTFLYYNKSLVSESDVRNMETLLAKSIPGVDGNIGIDMEDSYYTTMFLYTAGMEIFGRDGTDPNSISFANDAAIKGCRYIASLNNTKLKNIQKADQTAALKNGNVAAMISGPHMISQFRAALGSNFGVAMLPTIKLDGKETQLVSFSGVKMYGISNKPNRDQKLTSEACRLAAFLANADNQQTRLSEREFCPTDANLFKEAKASGIPTVEVVVKQSTYSKLKPGLAQMSAYWTPMMNFLTGVYKQTKPESSWMSELKAIEDKVRES